MSVILHVWCWWSKLQDKCVPDSDAGWTVHHCLVLSCPEVCWSDELKFIFVLFYSFKKKKNVVWCFLLMTHWCLPTFALQSLYLRGRGWWVLLTGTFPSGLFSAELCMAVSYSIWITYMDGGKSTVLSDNSPSLLLHYGLQVLFVHALVVKEACWKYQCCSYVNRYCDVWMFVCWNLEVCMVAFFS